MSLTLSPVDMIGKWISYDTTSRYSNLELIDWIRGYLDSHGIESELVFNDDGTKANLHAVIGPRVDGGVVLSGHTDVVPVDGQAWTSDPFNLVERGDKLYGRGTADMKSFCAIALAMVPMFKAADLKRPVHLAFSYDEELGCLGVGRLVDHMVARGPRPRAVIIGEATGMQVVNAHKGGLLCWTTVMGHSCHSSRTHEGVNAIAYAAELIAHVNRVAERWRAGPHMDIFDPPFSTLSVNQIEGGTGGNIIPAECRFFWEMRVLPGVSDMEVFETYRAFAMEDLLPRMKAVSAEADIVIDLHSRVPALRPEPVSDAEALAKLLVGTNEVSAVSYGTEGGYFQNADISTVVCGPGSIDQAHKPDEFIEASQVAACVAFMEQLAANLSA